MSRLWSDEDLKQAITQLEQALEALRKVETGNDRADAEVEAHIRVWSDAELKQAITQLEQALETLRLMAQPKA